MADLREKLLRAGLIDKKAKQAADTEARRARKQRKRQKKKKATAETTAPETEAERRYRARQAAQAEANRAREAARQARRAAHEQRNRVRNLVQAWAVRQRRPGPQRFCFVTRERRIRWIYVSAELAWRLEQGTLAIAEQPGVEEEPYAIVPRAIAARLLTIDPEAVRFWNREPSDGATGPPPRSTS